MSALTPILATTGIKALYAVYAWLLSAILSSELSKRKGYGEKVGLGTGLLLTVLGLVIWLLIPAKREFARGPGIRRLIPASAREGRSIEAD